MRLPHERMLPLLAKAAGPAGEPFVCAHCSVWPSKTPCVNAFHMLLQPSVSYGLWKVCELYAGAAEVSCAAS